MAVNTTDKQRGRPFRPGQSGNPAGRPPGAKNKATLMAQALLEGEAEILIRTIIDLAKSGDLQALKVCIDRLCPPMRAQSANIQVELPDTDNITEIANAFIRAAADGRLSPDTATQMVTALGTMARIEEIDSLKERLAALETAVLKK